MAARVQWTKGSEASFSNIPRNVGDQIYNELGGAMAQIIANAVKNAKAMTAERGRPSSASGGRIETGAMIDAIQGDIRATAKQIIGKFGFIDKQADYFLYQTVTGFTHWLSAEFIEPTFAIRDAELIAVQEVGAAISAAIRGVRL